MIALPIIASLLLLSILISLGEVWCFSVATGLFASAFVLAAQGGARAR